MSTEAGRPSILGTVLVSLALAGIGVVTLIDTSGYADADSVVFPRTVAIALIVFSLLALVRATLIGVKDEGIASMVWWRRILFVGSMFAGVLVMPFTGFLPAAMLAYAGCLIAAMYDRWTTHNALVYSVSGVAIIAAFHFLFKHILNVPLP